MPNLAFSDLYNFTARWAGDTSTTGVARAKDAVAEANRNLSYGTQLPALKPWWRKREDTVTPVAGTNAYAFPTVSGTLESPHQVWYRVRGNSFDIPIVDDEQWRTQATELSTVTGSPNLCNLFSDAGNVYKLRFDPAPSSAFISTIDGGLIRLDFYIEETLVAGSGDSVEPLMPNSRRMGIAFRAIEMLAASQGDAVLLAWAAKEGKQYYEMIFQDDVNRTGFQTRTFRPHDPMGLRVGTDVVSDYGHVRP